MMHFSSQMDIVKRIYKKINKNWLNKRGVPEHALMLQALLHESKELYGEGQDTPLHGDLSII